MKKRVSNDKKRLYNKSGKVRHGTWLSLYPLQGLQRWLKPPREALRMLYLKHGRVKI
jgi:hypothetical protein